MTSSMPSALTSAAELRDSPRHVSPNLPLSAKPSPPSSPEGSMTCECARDTMPNLAVAMADLNPFLGAHGTIQQV
jgi:hypothetical protein